MTSAREPLSITCLPCHPARTTPPTKPASGAGKGTLWLCRCSCGLYEYRRPETWESRPHPDDTCEVCLRAKGPNARQTAPERLRQWVDGLRDRGLTDTEIAWLRKSGSGVDTRGKTVAEIREQMAERM